MKTCSNCGKYKEDSKFYPDPNRKGGLTSRCIECATAIERQRCEEGVYFYGKPGYRRTRAGAKRRGWPFDITYEEYEHWVWNTVDSCEYCGISVDDFRLVRDFLLGYDGPDWYVKRFRRYFKSPKHKKIRFMTVERKDNQLGYTLDNMAKACWICNSLKGKFYKSEEIERLTPPMIAELLEKARAAAGG
jgi:hypothetical protein